MNPRDPAQRAADLMRDESVDGWTEISAAIMGKVRSTVVPSDPVVVHGPGGDVAQDAQGSRSYVSTRVVVAALRRRLTQATSSPSSINLTTDDDHRCTAVSVEIVCSWDTDFQAAGERARQVVVDTLDELVGRDPAFDPLAIRVHVDDVTAGDTRTT